MISQMGCYFDGFKSAYKSRIETPYAFSSSQQEKFE